MRDFKELNPVFKRLNSFVSYIVCAFASIIIPDIVDKALYETLKEQYKYERY